MAQFIPRIIIQFNPNIIFVLRCLSPVGRLLKQYTFHEMLNRCKRSRRNMWKGKPDSVIATAQIDMILFTVWLCEADVGINVVYMAKNDTLPSA